MMNYWDILTAVFACAAIIIGVVLCLTLHQAAHCQRSYVRSWAKNRKPPRNENTGHNETNVLSL